MAPEEFGHWLRQVRPPTEADANWAASVEGESALAAVRTRIERPAGRARFGAGRQGRAGWVWRRAWLPAGVLVAAAAVLVAVTASQPDTGSSGRFAAPGIGSVAPAPTGALPAMRPAAQLLQSARSCAGLLADLRRQTAAHVTAYGLPGIQGGMYAADGGAPAAAVPGAVAVPGAAAAPGGTSDTNVQEAGVDEPDVVKTDGERVVTVTDGVLRVLDASTATVSGSLDLRSYVGSDSAQLFVSGSHALVLLGGAGGGSYAPMYPRGAGYSNGTATSTYLFVDLSGQPTIAGTLRADGGYLDARMIGSTVRLVVTSAPVLNLPAYGGGSEAKAKAANQAAIGRAALNAWLPAYTVTAGTSTTQHRVPCGSVSLPAEFTGTSLQTIYTLDLAHPDTAFAPVTITADGDTVYADSESLYIASNPGWYGAGSTADTELHRFAISGAGAPVYLGSGKVPGRLLDSYSLSEYDGHLRVVTTAGGGTSQSSLYVLDAATLKTTGHVSGLGKGQQLYAVRFAGPLGYVVTFRQTDPLYVLDLRDPAVPKVAGELHITGYSHYLHDAGNGLLIGVGQDANTAGRVAGMQVSLFDVSDPGAPKLAAQVVLPTAVGEGQFDPHAFLYWQPTGLVVAPVDSWSADQSGKVLVLRLTGHSLTKVGEVSNPTGSAIPADGLGIQRSLLVGGRLWTLSGSGVRVSDPGTLTKIAWSPFA